MNKSTTKLDFDQIFLQVYKQPVTNTTPHKELVTLRKILTFFAEPGRRIAEIFYLIEKAELVADWKEKGRLKTTYLIFLTPCVIIKGTRRYSCIAMFTGILVIEWDHIDNAADFKQFIFETYTCVICCFLSPSRRGIKALVKIPIVHTVDEFKEYYFGIAAEMDQYPGFDRTGQNPVLPLFQSYDPDLLERNDPLTWTTKRIPAPPRPPAEPMNIPTNYSDKQRQSAARIIYQGFVTRFKGINDVGHPIVRSIAYTAGGYIAGGYLDELEVIAFLDSWIDTISYLNPKAETYKKTVRDMVNRGKAAPLKLNTTTTTTRPSNNQMNDFFKK